MLQPEHKAKLQSFVSEHNGKKLDPAKMMKANPMIAKILIARFMGMTDAQQQAIKGILTPDTADALQVLLPELSGIIKKTQQGVSGGTAG